MNFALVLRSTAASIAAIALAMPAGAQQLQLRAEWGSNATEYRGQVGRRVTLVCPPDGRVGDVFGTNTYTDDSSVCTSAVHAGVIPLRGGGVVTVVVGAGLPIYEASTRNGVTSQPFGRWSGSFSFDTTGGTGRVDWTTKAAGLELWRAPVTLECPALTSARVGAVWGSDVYTSDSSICAAAAHAGVIDAAVGGRVSVVAAGAQPSFAAATRNGVISGTYGGWPSSFRVASATSEGQGRRVATGQSSPTDTTPAVRTPVRPPLPVQAERAVLGRPPLGVQAITTPTLTITGLHPTLQSTHAIVTAQLAITSLYPPLQSTHAVTTPTLAITSVYLPSNSVPTRRSPTVRAQPLPPAP